MPATLILSALSITLTGTALAVATFAINFAVSYLVTRLFANGANTQTDNGVRQQVPPGTNNSIPVVYGDAYLGGTFVDAVLTTDQKTMYYVLAISSISPNGQFTFDQTKMYWADQRITFDGTDLTKVVSLTDGAGNVNTKISGNIYINLYTSNAAGTITSANGAAAPSSVMGGADIAAAQRWTGTRQMNGLAFAIIKLIYSQDAGTTQMQAITFHVSHYLNGAGAAVPGDVWYDYMTSEIYGGGMAAGLVNSASRTALNTYSNETITFTNSGGSPATQARYRINGVLDTGQNVLSNIDRILIACDSWNQYNAATGQWTAVINKATSTTFAFDDTNIIGEIKVSALDITSSINQVEASFPSKLNRDQTDVVFLETPSGLLYPNEPINKYSVSIDLSNDSVQTSYLANRLLEQAREDLIVTINAAYPAIQVDAGDVVSVTNTAYGWSAKLFRVMKITEVSMPDGNLGASLDLTEYNAAVYDDQDITQFSATPNSGLPSPGYFSALAAPTISASRPAATVPSFDVQVVTPTTGRVTSINLYYTTSASPGVTDWEALAIYETTSSQPIAPATTYTFDNIILPAGTYYYGAIVRNEASASALSTVSAATVWTPTGTTGTQGDSARIAYCKSTIAAPSGTTTSTGSASLPANGSFGLTGAVFATSPPALVTGEYLYQTDGIYVVSTNTISWATPYLSNLKVGSLSAISANLGVVEIASAGNLHSGKTTATDTTAGFFLGNDSGTPKFAVGNLSNSMTWDGTALTVNGAIIQTGNIAASGISSNSAYQTGLLNIYPAAGDVTATGTSSTIASLSGVTAGSTILVNTQMRIHTSCNNSAINQFWWQAILKDGGVFAVGSEGYAVASRLGAWRFFDITIPLTYMTTSAAAGTHNYTIEWTITPEDTSGVEQTFNASSVVYAQASIAATELKR